MTSEAQDSIRARLEEIDERLSEGWYSEQREGDMTWIDDFRYALDLAATERAAREAAERDVQQWQNDYRNVSKAVVYEYQRAEAAEARLTAAEAALSIAANTCADVTSIGRFSPIVDPVRWVEQLEAHLRAALASSTPTQENK